MLVVTIDSMVSKPEWPYMTLWFALVQWGKNSND